MKNRFRVKNQTDSAATLDIYGIIGDYWDDVDAKDVVKAIRGIKSDEIAVRIHSDGGSVFAGLAIYNALVEHPANINIQIDAMAASIASVIAMAGKVTMPENAFMMIHDPWGLVVGGADDMLSYAAVLEKIKGSLVGVYGKKTGLGNDEISSLMSAETWLTATEAKEKGFADIVSGRTDAKNMIMNSLKYCKNIPQEVTAIINDRSGEPEKGNEMEITLAILEEKAPELLAQIRAEAMEKGRAGELARASEVFNLSMPGHEALLEKMAFDGKTTAPEAALAVMAAEKQIRVNAKEAFAADGLKPVPQALAPEQKKVGPPKNGTWKDKANWEWDNKPETRQEFDDDKESFMAAMGALSKGLVKSIG